MDSRQKEKKRENPPLAIATVPLLPVRQEGPYLYPAAEHVYVFLLLCLRPGNFLISGFICQEKNPRLKMSNDMLKKNLYI